MTGIVHTIIVNRDLRESKISQREVNGINFYYPVKEKDLMTVKQQVGDVLHSHIDNNKIRSGYELDFYKPGIFGLIHNKQELWKIMIHKRDSSTWGDDEKKEALKNQLHQITKDILKQNVVEAFDSSVVYTFRTTSSVII